MTKRYRVLVAKPGLDGHDRGALVVARALRDAGMEAIYTGLRRTPEEIVDAAVQEDVDALGVSILSGAHHHLLSRILELLREKNMDDVVLFAGGIIPDKDIPILEKMGVQKVFQPGARTDDIVSFLRERLSSRGSSFASSS
jgi:methylmalonyl-CoA mutase C-terminal domain/subunit